MTDHDPDQKGPTRRQLPPNTTVLGLDVSPFAKARQALRFSLYSCA
jgi:hypothetical protein